MRTIAMNTTENGHDPKLGAPAPLFASSWMALLLLLRKEFSHAQPTESEHDASRHVTGTDDDNGQSMN